MDRATLEALSREYVSSIMQQTELTEHITNFTRAVSRAHSPDVVQQLQRDIDVFDKQVKELAVKIQKLKLSLSGYGVDTNVLEQHAGQLLQQNKAALAAQASQINEQDLINTIEAERQQSLMRQGYERQHAEFLGQKEAAIKSREALLGQKEQELIAQAEKLSLQEQADRKKAEELRVMQERLIQEQALLIQQKEIISRNANTILQQLQFLDVQLRSGSLSPNDAQMLIQQQQQLLQLQNQNLMDQHKIQESLTNNQLALTQVVASSSALSQAQSQALSQAQAQQAQQSQALSQAQALQAQQQQAQLQAQQPPIGSAPQPLPGSSAAPRSVPAPTPAPGPAGLGAAPAPAGLGGLGAVPAAAGLGAVPGAARGGPGPAPGGLGAAPAAAAPGGLGAVPGGAPPAGVDPRAWAEQQSHLADNKEEWQKKQEQLKEEHLKTLQKQEADRVRQLEEEERLIRESWAQQRQTQLSQEQAALEAQRQRELQEIEAKLQRELLEHGQMLEASIARRQQILEEAAKLREQELMNKQQLLSFKEEDLLEKERRIQMEKQLAEMAKNRIMRIYVELTGPDGRKLDKILPLDVRAGDSLIRVKEKVTGYDRDLFKLDLLLNGAMMLADEDKSLLEYGIPDNSLFLMKLTPSVQVDVMNLIPCEDCGKAFDREVFGAHKCMKGFQQQLPSERRGAGASSGASRSAYGNDRIGSVSRAPAGGRSETRTVVRESSNSLSACEFCGGLFPSDGLANHRSTCPSRRDRYGGSGGGGSSTTRTTVVRRFY